MRNNKKGFSVLDILIIVLIVAVILALLIPKLKKDQSIEDEKIARERMVLIAAAMDSFYHTAGYTIGLTEEVETDSLADSLAEESEIEQTEEAVEDSLPKIYYLYTDDRKKLNLPEDFRAVSPPNDKEFKVFFKDSSYYAIYDPNGHGTVLNGKALWESD